MQTGDQEGRVGWRHRNMRILSAALFCAALTLPSMSSAQTDPAWQTCTGTKSVPDDRISACASVIDAKSETGRKLAAAYCNRGHGLTEKRELDAALADLNE